MADTCSHSQFLCRMLEFKDFFPLVGAALVAVTAASVGVFATWKLNTAMKRTEFFLRFTERFHKILADIDALHFEMEKDPNHVKPEVRRKQAHGLYRQFFGLMFDEFFAYQRRFLDRAVFIEWMKWRYFDANPPPGFRDYKFKIADVGYLTGWTRWVKKPSFRVHPFVAFMTEIHCKKSDAEIDSKVRSIVLRYGPLPQRFSMRIADWIRRNVGFVVVVGVPTLVMLINALLW